MGRVAHRHRAYGHDVHRDGVRVGRAVFHDSDGGRGIRVRAAGDGTVGRVHDGDGDPDRVRHRPGGYRHVHRGLRGDPHRNRRVDRLPRVLLDLRGHPPLRRRGGAEGDVRHNGRGRRGAGGVRDRHDPTVRGIEPVHHRPHERGGGELVLTLRGCRRLGGVSVRDLVLPRDRGRAPRRRGDQGSIDRHAQGAHRRHGRAAPVRGARPLFRPRRAGAAAFTSEEMLAAPSVLPLALEEAYGGGNALVTFVNIAGLTGLIASFFSIIFAYSRQTFALSRAGYLPRLLSITSGRMTPWMALIVPGVIGFLLALTGDGATLINIAVFGATISYALMMLSHIVLRRREPDLDRPYRTPGGVATSGVALVLAVLAVIATFIVDIRAALITLGVYALFLAYFGLYSRRHLVAQAPEEEFATIERAESELAGS